MEKKVIAIEQVRYIAHLARLELSPEEEVKFTEQLKRILAYVEKLQELDTTGVPLTSQILSLQDVFREDECGASLAPEDVFANAPAHTGNLFQVPKFLG